MSTDNPILNNPYEEPKLHYSTVTTGPEKGSLDYTQIVKGRRVFDPDSEGQAMPSRSVDPQEQMFKVNDFAESFKTHIINLCRSEVGIWRKEDYPNTTRITFKINKNILNGIL